MRKLDKPHVSPEMLLISSWVRQTAAMLILIADAIEINHALRRSAPPAIPADEANRGRYYNPKRPRPS